MKATKLFLFIIITILLTACSTYHRDPAQTNCNKDSFTNAGTHFEDYERCKDL